MFNNKFLRNSFGLAAFFCVSLSLAEISQAADTKNLKASSGFVKPGGKSKASSDSEKPKPSSEAAQVGKKLKASSKLKSVQSGEKLKASSKLKSVQSGEKLKASSKLKSVQSGEKLKSSSAPAQTGEKLKASLDPVHSEENPLKTRVFVKSFKENYRFYAGPSLLRRAFNERSRFFGETFTLGLSRKNWEHRDIYINIRPLIETDRKVTHLEFLTRLFCSLSFENLKTYTGIGMGFGLSPYHIYSKNRNIDRILSLNYQLFTGLRLLNVYKDFGVFGEINVTGLFFPFFYIF